MYLGFDNGFIIKDIFGDEDVFTGAEIDNINYRPLSGRMTMDVLTKCDLNNPPKKWSSWDYICLKLELFAIKEFKIKIHCEPLFVDVFSINKELDKYVLEIIEKDKVVFYVNLELHVFIILYL